jgi:hypothetical protein
VDDGQQRLDEVELEEARALLIEAKKRKGKKARRPQEMG